MDISQAWIAMQEIINGAIHRAPYFLLALIVFMMFYFAGRVARRSIRHLAQRRKRHHNLGIVLGRLIQGLIILLGTLIALVIVLPNFKPGQLVDLLGIGSVAIGFAFRDILQNFLAGILILLTEPFRIDDQIRFKDFEGTVENVQTRATFIRTYDGRRIVIPNAELFTNSVTVLTAFPERRLEYDIGIGYGDDIPKARSLILEAIHGIEGVLSEPPPDVLVMGFASSSVTLRARWWIRPPRRADVMDSMEKVLEAIKQKLQAGGVDLPFETRTILFHDQTDTFDGDRSRQREGWPVPSQGEAPAPRSMADAIQQLARARKDKESTGNHESKA